MKKEVNEEKEKKVSKKTETEEEKEVKIVYKEKEKPLFTKIMNIVLWVILLAWMAICLVDFFKVTNEKEPIFCLKKETTVYSDGEVHSCLGLGYKVYNYERESYSAIEFGPFWSKDRSNDTEE